VTFQDDFKRMLDDAYSDMAPPMLGEAFGGPPTEPQPTITVQRVSAFIQVSTEAFDAPYVPRHVPWHRRARWRWQAWRERAGRRVGGWLAGVDLTERDDY
jgi:hypothetical protein